MTISVEEHDDSLTVGTTATVDVTTASAEGSVLVPISAVTLTGTSTGTVRRFSDGSVTTQEVKLGIRGTTHVEVAEGLSAGESVVLSDASQAIPTSDSSSQQQTGPGVTGLGGSGGMGGGMPPGR